MGDVLHSGRLGELVSQFAKALEGGKSVIFNVVDIHDNHVYFPTEEASLSEKKEKTRLMDDAEVRECINLVLHRIKKNRHWFCIVKPLMWEGQVKMDDFKAAANLIGSLYPSGGIPDIVPADLQVMNVGSFAGPLEKWTLADGPFKRYAEFKEYFDLAKDFQSIIRARLL